jgi:hypothetical protein
MKTRLFLAALLIAPLLTPWAVAQQDIKPLALLGTWQASAPHPSGAVITSTVRITQDQKFKGSTTANEKSLMESSGTWSLKGNALEWKYEYSSQPAIPVGFIDTDEVLSVSDSELRLVSKLSGKTHTYRRVR